MTKTKDIRYIVAGPARSGTTVTHLALMGHPNVSALNDELEAMPFFSKGFASFTSGAEKEKEKQEGLSFLFDALTSVYKNETTLARGMKTTIQSEIAAEEFVGALRTNLKDVRIILTSRTDLVAQYGSLQLALQTGRYHSWSKKKRNNKNNIDINRNDFIEYTYSYLKIIRRLNELNESHEVLNFNFEDSILSGDLEEYFKLFDFLELPGIEIDWLNSKKVSPPPANYINEYDYFYSLMEEIIALEVDGYTREEVLSRLIKKSIMSALKVRSKKARKKISQLLNISTRNQ